MREGISKHLLDIMNFRSCQQLLEASFDMDRTIFNTKLANLELPNIRIAIAGMPGQDKCTLINILANMFEGRKYTDPRAVAKPQTLYLNNEPGSVPIKLEVNISDFLKPEFLLPKASTTYRFLMTNSCVTLIDTNPCAGLAAIETGQDYLESLKSAIQQSAEALKQRADFDALCLVFKGSQKVCGESLSYFVKQYYSDMPANVKKKTIFCFSFSTSLASEALDSLVQADASIKSRPNFSFFTRCLIPYHFNYLLSCQSHVTYSPTLQISDWAFNCRTTEWMLLTISHMISVLPPTPAMLTPTAKTNLHYSVNRTIKEFEKIQAREANLLRMVQEIEGAIQCLEEAQKFDHPSLVLRLATRTRTITTRQVKMVPRYVACIKHGACHADSESEKSSLREDSLPNSKERAIFPESFFTGKVCTKCGCSEHLHVHCSFEVTEHQAVEEYQAIELEQDTKDAQLKQSLRSEISEKLRSKRLELEELNRPLLSCRFKKRENRTLIAHLNKKLQKQSPGAAPSNNYLEYLDFKLKTAQQMLHKAAIDQKQHDAAVTVVQNDLKLYREIEQDLASSKDVQEEAQQLEIDLASLEEC